MSTLHLVDPEIYALIEEEKNRQHTRLELIASENFVSQAVLEAQASVLTNKYAEGYPNKRFYKGCEFVDEVEELAITRAKKLFGGDHVNVQPHAGAPANLAVFVACLQPGDVILGMDLSHGGHLTHGSPASISGKYFKAYSYGVDRETGFLDYDNLLTQAKKYRPRLIIAGASSYPRAIDFTRFRQVADEVGAYLLVDMAHIAGLVAAGLHPDPVPLADFVTSTTHKTLRGPRGGFIICRREYARAVDRALFPGIQGGPLMHTIAAKAVAFREALQPEFAAYQGQVVKNAATLAGALKAEGFQLVSGGTDNHLLLIDLRETKITGAAAADSLEEIGIITNKNTIPYDPSSPLVTSGLRLGTPAVTSRGMQEKDMSLIARIIREGLQEGLSGEGKEELKKKVKALVRQYPLYRETHPMEVNV